ncbi:MAG TPA: hypothetical protein P5550_11265 [Bacteroidales bacterium]|nr:hypothetical protein [Bacteroidales bacterium]
MPPGAEHLKLGILRDFNEDHRNYVSACEEAGVDYAVIDVMSPDWIRRVQDSGCDGFLMHPPNDIQERKSMLDEVAWVLEQVLGKVVYPSFRELYIYENKRNMAWWLQSTGFPHPPTYVFARRAEAEAFLRQAPYPLVFKTNIGAGASGVRFIHSRGRALRIARRVFGRFHPALTFGDVRFSRKYKGIPLPLFGRVQKHYLIVQDFIPILWEWRMIRIGDSYFGHKKLLRDGFASGSGKASLERPPDALLHLTREVCERGGFRSMNLDVFETADGRYLINELQTIFGSYKPVQMRVDGIPGRFVYDGARFIFEEGVFNQHGSHLLRVMDLIGLLLKKNPSP